MTIYDELMIDDKRCTYTNNKRELIINAVHVLILNFVHENLKFYPPAL